MLCAATLTIAAQSKQPRTVEDFYLLLPAKYIQPLTQAKNRKGLIAVKDVADGYLRLESGATGLDWEGWAEIALFKKTNGEYVVGVVDGSCATICYSGVEFLEYANGKWTSVTKKIMPEISDAMTLARYKKLNPDDTEFDAQNPPYTSYKLPRKGTTVILNANLGGDTDIALFEFVWNGKTFAMKK